MVVLCRFYVSRKLYNALKYKQIVQKHVGSLKKYQLFYGKSMFFHETTGGGYKKLFPDVVARESRWCEGIISKSSM